MRTFTIKATGKKKYPYKVKYPDGLKILVPSQWDFDVYDINKKGCIIAAFYMGLRFSGAKKSMMQCLRYLQNTADKGSHKNYCLKQVAAAINRLSGGATFYKKPSRQKIKKALKNGHMVLFTEKNPIHTVVLLDNEKKIIRFSDGKYKSVTVAQEVKKRSGDPWYGGCVIIKRR